MKICLMPRLHACTSQLLRLLGCHVHGCPPAPQDTGHHSVPLCINITGLLDADVPAVQPARGIGRKAIATTSRVSPTMERANPSGWPQQMQGPSSDGTSGTDPGDHDLPASARLAAGFCDRVMCCPCVVHSAQDPHMGLPGTSFHESRVKFMVGTNSSSCCSTACCMGTCRIGAQMIPLRRTGPQATR